MRGILFILAKEFISKIQTAIHPSNIAVKRSNAHGNEKRHEPITRQPRMTWTKWAGMVRFPPGSSTEGLCCSLCSKPSKTLVTGLSPLRCTCTRGSFKTENMQMEEKNQTSLPLFPSASIPQNFFWIWDYYFFCSATRELSGNLNVPKGGQPRGWIFALDLKFNNHFA